MINLIRMISRLGHTGASSRRSLHGALRAPLKWLAALGVGLSLSISAHGQYVHTNGTEIVDANGEPLYFSGINLGNWLLWEGYLMMGDFNYRTHTQFLNDLGSAFGSMALAREFEHQWRLHYVDDKAMADLKALGFNSVRVPFHYKMFWQDGSLTDHGFQYFDQVIEAARVHGIYVLLDMHAAPGYQNPGDHADNLDSNASQPRDTVKFWDGNNVWIASQVWRHIANRYKNEPVIWGYDLINEPVPQPGRENELLGSLVTMRNAIREVDNNHIIVAEGSWWSSDLTKLDWTDPQVQQASGVYSQWDDKLVYQLHHYGPLSDTLGREALTNRLGIPLIIGEYGETDNGNLAAMTDWAKQNLAGYFPWSFKKMSHDKTLWTIPPNAAYNAVKDYINHGTALPAGTYEAMLDFAQNNIRNGHSSHQWHQGFYDAIKPSEGSDNPANPVCNQDSTLFSLPGTLQAEDFCEQQGVQTEVTGDVGGGENIGYIDGGDWVAYRVHINSGGNYAFALRVASPEQSASIDIALDGAVLASVQTPVTGGWQTYQTLETGPQYLAAGEYLLRLNFNSPGVNVNWLGLLETENGGGTGSPCDGVYVELPSRLQAESYCDMQGVQTQATSDVGGGENVGWIDSGDWLQFGVRAATDQQLLLKARIASPVSVGRMEFVLNGVNLGGFDITATGGWQQWQTLEMPVSVSAGEHTLRVNFPTGRLNVNWIEFVTQDTGPGDPDAPASDLAAGTYVIVNEFSGHALDVADVSTANGANVQQWAYSQGANQQWQAVPLGGGDYTFTAQHSGACLDADAGGDNVHQWRCAGNDNQTWHLEQQTDGSFLLRSAGDGMVLEVSSANNGANVRSALVSQSAQQRWRFNPVN